MTVVCAHFRLRTRVGARRLWAHLSHQPAFSALQRWSRSFSSPPSFERLLLLEG